MGPHVYNPSTYSYLLTPTTGWSPSKGDTMSQFVNYVLTLGQQTAPSFGYASLGLSLEQYGVNAVQKPTCPARSRRRRRNSRPTPAVTSHPPRCRPGRPPRPVAWSTRVRRRHRRGERRHRERGGRGGGGDRGRHGRRGWRRRCQRAAGSGSGGSGSGGGADPGVALTGTPSMAGTGIDAFPLVVLGVSLLPGRVRRSAPGPQAASGRRPVRKVPHARRAVLATLAGLVVAVAVDHTGACQSAPCHHLRAR